MVKGCKTYTKPTPNIFLSNIAPDLSAFPIYFIARFLGRSSPISRQVDADHTGTITLDELKAYFDRVGIQHDDLTKTFQALDVDKDRDDGDDGMQLFVLESGLS